MRNKLLSKLIVSALGLFAGLLLAEAGLRVAGYSYPSFYILDPHRGWAYRPGAEGWFVKEGRAYIRINREGFRDVDHTVTKPENTIRIAILGDSFAAALQLPIESTFWYMLEKDLAGCEAFVNQKVEVLNFGGSGYGTAQELITYQRYARKYDPDIVFLAFFSGNDVADNYRALDTTVGRPYYVFEGTELSLDGFFREETEFRLSNLQWAHVASIVDKVRLLQVLKNVRQYGLHLFQSRNKAGLELGTSAKVFLPPSDNNWEQAWRVTEQLLTTLRKEVELAGADFWLMAIPPAVQIHPEAEIRRVFMEELGVDTLSYPEIRLGSWADREDTPFVGLSNGLGQHAESQGVFLYGFGEGAGTGHWNEHGHRLASRIVAQRICQAFTEPDSP
jgi:hypothetical protein